MGRLEGKAALISGGAQGQGESEVRLFAKEGARIVFGDILDAKGKKVESEINEAGGVANVDEDGGVCKASGDAGGAGGALRAGLL